MPRQIEFRSKLSAEIYEAIPRGNARNIDRTEWEVDYSGGCESPVRFTGNDDVNIIVRRLVRCRKCRSCLNARRRYWAAAAVQQTAQAAEHGGRTWFGTLTLSPEAQSDVVRRALERWLEATPGTGTEPPAWWAEPLCDYRFRFVRDELLGDVQRFWKRLRKAGYRFKYLVVFERHKTGLPHLHFLVHEQGTKITKRALQAQWPFGYTNVSIVGGRSRRAADPKKAGWYVAKYLSKSYQARQLASRLYRPAKRSGYRPAHSDLLSIGAKRRDVTRTKVSVGEALTPQAEQEGTATNVTQRVAMGELGGE